MRRLVFWTIAGVLVLNLVGISIICINFLSLSKEVERTLFVNRSLLVRTEVFEKSLSLLEKLTKGEKEDVKELVSEINLRFSECYTCHHRDDTLSRIAETRKSFESALRTMNENKPLRTIRSDMAQTIQGFITFAFRKAKESSSASTSSLEFSFVMIKRYMALTIGLTLIVFVFFSYFVLRKGEFLEKEIKEKERVITDWALEWQNTFDATLDKIIVLGEDYKPLVFNLAASEFFGSILFSKDELFKILNLYPSDLSSPVSRTIEIKDRIFSLRIHPLHETNRKCIIVLRDITKEKELDERVKRAEKLATLGIMAGGIAHEINNPLSPIMGYSETLYELEKDEQKRRYIEQIILAAQRIERIVKDLLFFAREQLLKKTSERIEDVVDNVINTLKDMKPLKDVKIIKELAYTGTVNIDKGLFEIALLNLLKNAIQAIEGSRKGDTVRIATHREGSLLKITVSDNGPGIPEKLLTYIFDPFVTTKEVGKGTGLGLSITHRIITAHGGDIRVSSKEGEGTTFTITIPA